MVTKAAYLATKRHVDDRAINRHVLGRFVEALEELAADDEVEILEVGAGTGAMVLRLAAWDCLPNQVRYQLVDSDPGMIAVARQRVPRRLAAAGWTVDETDGVRAHAGDRTLELSFAVADGRQVDATADACILAAVADLLELPDDIAALGDRLRDGGVLYAPITYDGATRFEPSHPLDTAIERHYHHHMAAIRDAPGGPRAGSELQTALQAIDATVMAAGGSPWLLTPKSTPDPDSVVSRALLETMEEALAAVPAVSRAERGRWLETRRDQLAAGELVVTVANRDVLAKR